MLHELDCDTSRKLGKRTNWCSIMNQSVLYLGILLSISFLTGYLYSTKELPHLRHASHTMSSHFFKEELPQELQQ